MSSHNEIDERFDELVTELRSGRVAASAELRDRVRAIAVEAPAARPARLPFAERFPLRRAALVLVPACVVAAGSAAVLHGLTSSEKPSATADVRAEAVFGAHVAKPKPPLAFKQAPGVTGAPSGGQVRSAAPSTAAAAPPAGGRYQDYRVTMRVRVRGLNALSRSVVKAMRVTRSLGGYVASVRYSSPSVQHGDAVLLLRVPVGNIQQAVLSYSGLGSLVAQQFSVVDVQKRYDAQIQQIADLRALIAKLEAKLAEGSLSTVDEAHVREQLEYSRARLTRLTADTKTTLNHARLATARLSLTTFHPRKKHVVPATPTRIDRTLDDAGRVLGHEAVWALYALVVAGPFALLGLLAIGMERSRRRRVERRLLAAAR